MNGAVLTVDQMRAAERAAMDSGTSEWELMQRAGEGAAEWVARVAGGRSIAFLCGPGNNGGDGYVIAESLRRRGNEVIVVAPKPPATDTAQQARNAFGGSVTDGELPTAQVYVDCLFGYGLSRRIEGAFADLLAAFGLAGGYKIAIDVPSGIASDTGEALGPLLEYDLTLALGAWKHAHYSMPAMASMGARRLVPIGIDWPDECPVLSTPPKLAPPPADAHKYKRGLLAIVAGEMPGAPLLAAEAAMRGGAGYVKLLSDHSHPDAPAELVMTDHALSEVLGDKRISACLVGPGLGRSDAACERLAATLASGHPTVLDADALHLLGPSDLGNPAKRQIIVTPHEGELAQLCETFGIEVSSKVERARRLHKKTGMTVLAKGPDTVLAGAAGTRFFPRGSSWLSAAGTGDVLAGIAASRLAVHGDVFAACEEAVWLHHEAAASAGPAFTAGGLARIVDTAMGAYL